MMDMSSAPDSMFVGNYAPSHVLEQINRDMGAERIHFGSVGERFNSLFNTFDNLFVKTLNTAKIMIDQTKKVIQGTVTMIPILTEDDLYIVPENMHIPLLAYEPLRKLHVEEKIDGWGVSPDWVPNDDPWKPVLEFGYIETDPITGDLPEEVFWQWSTHDPELSDSEVEALRESRRYFETMIAQELGKDGQMRDPTGWCDGLLIGELID